MNIWHDKYGTRHVDSDAAPVHKTMDGSGESRSANSSGSGPHGERTSRVAAHQQYAIQELKRAAGVAPGPSTPSWAPLDKTVYLHSAHVAEYRNHSADAAHRWAEEHGEDINEPFAELTELQGEL
jgi:hypothetical protein